MQYLLKATSLAALVALAACSSSDGDSEETYITPSSIDATTALADYETLQAAIDNGDIDPITVQPTGSVEMAGYVGLSDVGENEDMTALGALAMTADFDTDTVSGTASDFGLFDEDTEALQASLAGTLDVAGTISGSGMTADVTGTLTESDGFENTVDLDLAGTFYDNSGQLVVEGDVTGTVNGEAEAGAFYATE